MSNQNFINNTDNDSVQSFRVINFDMQGFVNNFANKTNLFAIFDDCVTMRANPVCGSRVVNFAYAYGSCKNITGSPVCGDNVTNMQSTYSYCSNLTGAPVVGPKVPSMYMTYYYCSNLTGPPVCGSNVTNMQSAYYHCYNLTGVPVVGSKVTDMLEAYSGTNVIGSPVCGPNVVNFRLAYSYCNKIDGPAEIGSKVTNAFGAFRNCDRFVGPCVIHSNSANTAYMFAGANTQREKHIFATKNSATYTNLTKTSSDLSLTGTSLEFYNYQSLCNEYYNISLYAVENTANLIAVYTSYSEYSPENIQYPIITTNTTSNYTNYVAIVTGGNHSRTVVQGSTAAAQSISEPQVVSLTEQSNNVSAKALPPTFLVEIYKQDNVKVTGFNFMSKIHNQNTSEIQILHLSHDVTNISRIHDCLLWGKGFAWCGPNVTNMYSAYRYCNRIFTGPPVCGPNVTDMAWAFENCENMTQGPPVCGPNVVNLTGTYAYCSNITGTAEIGPKVEEALYAFQGCSKINGAIIHNGLNHLGYAIFKECSNIKTLTIPPSVTSFGERVVEGCNRLAVMAFPNHTTVPSIYNTSLGWYSTGDLSSAKHCYYLVPANLYNTWRNTQYWNNASYVQPYIYPINKPVVLYDTLNNFILGKGETKTFEYTILDYYNSYASININSTWSSLVNSTSNTVTYESDMHKKVSFTVKAGSTTGSCNLEVKTQVGSLSASTTLTVTVVEEVEPTFTVEAVSDASYGFSLNSDGYYESNNQGVGNSAALCKLIINNPSGYTVYLDCINYGESSYDYGLISNVGYTLSTNNSNDSDSTPDNVLYNFKGSQSADIQTVDLGAAHGTVYIKYRKDSSVNSNNDSLQFKVRFGSRQ